MEEATGGIRVCLGMWSVRWPRCWSWKGDLGRNCHFGVSRIVIIYTFELDELTQKVRVKGTGKAEPAALRIQRGLLQSRRVRSPWQGSVFLEPVRKMQCAAE